jgi:ribosome-binding ATPase YchF (GTP1/OBG family)
MTKPIILIHDVETNETVEREMNAKEFTQYQADQIAASARIEAEIQKAADKAALLEKLGITEDEARLLLG